MTNSIESRAPLTPKPAKELLDVPVVLFASRAPAAEAFLKLLEQEGESFISKDQKFDIYAFIEG